ncbi:MAG TPA: phosphoribosylaminoimidazolesuccinocarboxamide synthase [Syntrophales bacterium]|nr:phosphoribosylaminoimidazolesuccinocarboxamide synthase [Syntrophales bacterium]
MDRHKTVYETHFPGLKRVAKGKVRDIYEVDSCLLIVATDRISAFDVVMKEPIPGKGEVLTRMSAFWFSQMADIIPNHLISTDPHEYPEVCRPYWDELQGRSMLVKRAKPLPVECIIRGYLSGSGWEEYKKSRTIAGISLPEGLKESSRLPKPIFTPSTKAPEGSHDETITQAEVRKLIGWKLTEEMVEAALKIYARACSLAERAGIIIADTKMEFGLYEGNLILIDELLTPDSSRFWPRDEYEEGRPQKSFDKQYLRDYLTSVKWDKNPPPPPLPTEVIEQTAAKYREALKRLTAIDLTEGG